MARKAIPFLFEARVRGLCRGLYRFAYLRHQISLHALTLCLSSDNNSKIMVFVKKVSLVLVFVIFLSAKSFASDLPHYEIKATLDTEHKIIKAHQKVTVVNTSDKPWTDIYFHVYPNRFYTAKEKNKLMR